MKTADRSKVAQPVFIGKWTVRTLFLLNEKPHRPAQLRRQLGGVSQRMLTRTLRNLESGQLVARSVSGPNASVVEYSLTELGATFVAPLMGMCEWARRHRKYLCAELRLVDAPGTH